MVDLIVLVLQGNIEALELLNVLGASLRLVNRSGLLLEEGVNLLEHGALAL